MKTPWKMKCIPFSPWLGHRCAPLNLRLKKLFIQPFMAIFFMAAMLFFAFSQDLRGEETAKTTPPEKPAELTLVQAVICEELKELEPRGEAIVFSAKAGNLLCFTSFDPVPEKTEIFHHWFRRDQSGAKMKLVLKPPKWSAFSKMRIGASDTGPWRVEITDQNGKIFQTLRFSVTE